MTTLAMKHLQEVLEAESQVAYFLNVAACHQYDQSKCHALSTAHTEGQICGTTNLPCFSTTKAAIAASAATMSPVPLPNVSPACVSVSWCFPSWQEMLHATRELQTQVENDWWMGTLRLA